jgi:hypothetical protein
MKLASGNGSQAADKVKNRLFAEIQIRAAILNGFAALGLPRTVAVG